ncbi:MAG: fluoride efflux transporter CrcB [Bacteroidetes bacterium]|nr:MAG: fluoride efflux transporter CrcB [Bacteroidota bacterium]
MYKILLLVSGGAIGTVARYFISGVAQKYMDSGFPWGTLVVNITGAFVIGLIWGLFETVEINSGIRAFIFIGILGGFTTFSSFALETMNLYKQGEIKIAILNILANNTLSIILVFVGFMAARGILGIIK